MAIHETFVTLSDLPRILRIQTVGLEERGSGMGLGRDEAIAGLLAEYDAFGALVRSLDERQWEQPSRCEGWTVGDVARHAVGTATDVANGVAGTHTPEEEVAERKGHHRRQRVERAQPGARPHHASGHPHPHLRPVRAR
ncbi:MAG: maleylpyruvate isomerase family protein [Actinobacteria bacterium]|nr:MAG: maleylpyruvate isomerase family protein [Actinomycetota bacterium]